MPKGSFSVLLGQSPQPTSIRVDGTQPHFRCAMVFRCSRPACAQCRKSLQLSAFCGFGPRLTFNPLSVHYVQVDHGMLFFWHGSWSTSPVGALVSYRCANAAAELDSLHKPRSIVAKSRDQVESFPLKIGRAHGSCLHHKDMHHL